jgi:hypothetical protein
MGPRSPVCFERLPRNSRPTTMQPPPCPTMSEASSSRLLAQTRRRHELGP